MTTTIARTIAQTRHVFKGDIGAEQVLSYLEQVLAADQANADYVAAWAGLRRAINQSQARAAAAGPATSSGAAPAPADVMLLILAELRGLRADMDADRFAARAAVDQSRANAHQFHVGLLAAQSALIEALMKVPAGMPRTTDLAQARGEIASVAPGPDQDGTAAVEAWIKDFLYARSLALPIPPPGPEVILALQTFAEHR